MSPPGRETAEVPPGCARFRALARGAILWGAPEPSEVKAHAQACPDCRQDLEDTARLDAVLVEAFRATRCQIAGPSANQVESILAGASPNPRAKLWRQIRRTVRRMLWVSFLLLSLLPLCALAWWLARFFAGGTAP